MKKRLLAPMAVIASLCLALLTACGGPSTEDLIRTDLTDQFDAVKSGDEDMLKEIEDASGDDFADLGIDSDDFATAYLDGFDYSIGDITVDDSTATAQVTVSCKSMKDIMEQFQAQFTQEVASSDLSTMTEDGLYARAGEILLDVTKNAEVKDTDCTFTYEKGDDGAWTATSDASTEMMNAMMA